MSDLTSEALLAALSRFTDRRGCPSTILSDNATNFVGACGGTASTTRRRVVVTTGSRLGGKPGRGVPEVKQRTVIFSNVINVVTPFT